MKKFTTEGAYLHAFLHACLTGCEKCFGAFGKYRPHIFTKNSAGVITHQRKTSKRDVENISDLTKQFGRH